MARLPGRKNLFTPAGKPRLLSGFTVRLAAQYGRRRRRRDVQHVPLTKTPDAAALLQHPRGGKVGAICCFLAPFRELADTGSRHAARISALDRSACA